MSDDFSYIVDEPRRTELLKSFGISDGVISLGSGDKIPDPVFDYYCQKPKFVPDSLSFDADGPIVAIYESQYDETYAVTKKKDSLEFLYINTKNTEDVTSWGDSEQCLLRALFELIVDAEYNVREDIERAAEVIGFEYLADTYAFIFSERKKSIYGSGKKDMKAYFERKLAYIRGEFRPGLADPGI